MGQQLLTLLITCLGFSSVAQPIYQFPGTERKWSKHVQRALDKKQPSTQKTTAAHERLVGFSTYTFNGSGLSISDSSNFKYSLDRGIMFNPNNMFIDEASILFDSMTQFTDNGTNFDVVYSKKSTYDGSNRRITLTELIPASSTMENNTEERYSYNSNGYISVIYELFWDAPNSTWDTSVRTDFEYDSQNNLIADSTYSYMSGQWASKTEYTVDGNGNTTQVDYFDWNVGWVPTERELHTFNTDGNIIRSVSQTHDGLAYVNTALDSFGYNSGATIYHYYEGRTWHIPSADWRNESREFRTINSSNRITQQSTKTWDTIGGNWEDNVTIDWDYSSFGNPTKGIVTIDQFGLEAANVFLYYETYYDLAVQNVKNNKGKLTAYPNPATDKLILSLQTPVHNASIQLTSMIGQTVFRTNQPFTGTSVEIPVNNLQPGTYRLTLHDGSGAVLYNEAVVKQ
jgi:hypothetical protein